MTAGLKGRVVPPRAEGGRPRLDARPTRSARSSRSTPTRSSSTTRPARSCSTTRTPPGPPGQRLVPEVAAGWPSGHRRWAHVHLPDPVGLRLLAAVERARHAPSPSGTRSSACSRRRLHRPVEPARRRRRRKGLPRREGRTRLRRLDPRRHARDPARQAGVPTSRSGSRCPSSARSRRTSRRVPHGLPYPIPSAGPYYLADRSSDVFVLKRNPNYHGPRPRRLDAIVYRTGIDVGTRGTPARARHGRLHRSRRRRARPDHCCRACCGASLPPHREQLDRAARAQHAPTALRRPAAASRASRTRSTAVRSPTRSTVANSSFRRAVCFRPTSPARPPAPATRSAPTCASPAR